MKKSGLDRVDSIGRSRFEARILLSRRRFATACRGSRIDRVEMKVSRSNNRRDGKIKDAYMITNERERETATYGQRHLSKVKNISTDIFIL